MNAFLNAENFSQNDLQALLFKPINLFGYRFLVNVVTFLWMYNGLRYSSIELPDSEKPFNFIIIGGGTGDKTSSCCSHADALSLKQRDRFSRPGCQNMSTFVFF